MLSNKFVLITNDDGIDSPYLKVLVQQVYKFTNKIVILVPDKENSAASQKMTLKTGLTLNKVNPLYKEIPTYTTSGTPVDCVKLALYVLKIRPDFVVSGMNYGLNLGDDILFSGTIGACFAAAQEGYKSIAFSCERDEIEAAKNIPDVLEYLNTSIIFKDKEVINVNMPINPIGIKVTKQGRNPFDTYYEEIQGLYYARGTMLGNTIEKDPNTDVRAYFDNYISITPLTTDRTQY